MDTLKELVDLYQNYVEEFIYSGYYTKDHFATEMKLYEDNLILRE